MSAKASICFALLSWIGWRRLSSSKCDWTCLRLPPYLRNKRDLTASYASKEYPNPAASPARHASKRSILNCGDNDVMSTQLVKATFQRWKSILFPAKIGIRILSNCHAFRDIAAVEPGSETLAEHGDFGISGGGILTEYMWSKSERCFSRLSDSLGDFSCDFSWLRSIDFFCCDGSWRKSSVTSFSIPNSSSIASSWRRLV